MECITLGIMAQKSCNTDVRDALEAGNNINLLKQTYEEMWKC